MQPLKMKSALTRRVFRHLLRCEAIAHSPCRWSQQSRAARAFGSTASRSSWDLGFGPGRPKQKRELKPENVDPGYKTMANLIGLLRQKVRPPPREELQRAFAAFFSSRARSRTKMTNLQVETALATLKHLQLDGCESGVGAGALFDVLRSAKIRVLGFAYDENRANLVRLAYEELTAGNNNLDELFEEATPKSWRTTALEEADSSDTPSTFRHWIPTLYFRCMARFGPPMETLSFMLKYLQDNSELSQYSLPWHQVIQTAARTGDRGQLERVLSLAGDSGIKYDEAIHLGILKVFEAANDLQTAKDWYITKSDIKGSASLSRGSKAGFSAHAVATMFWMSLKHNDVAFAGEIIDSIFARHEQMASVLTHSEWKMVFAWAAASGKSIEEIEQMFGVMDRRLEAADIQWEPKKKTDLINALIKVATQRNDGYKAERFLSLGRSMGCFPDASTYILMMDYRMKSGDSQGALRAFKEVQNLNIEDRSDIVVEPANKLILSLYEQGADIGLIMEIVTDLIDRSQPFTPPVVASLCRLHLRQDELHDAIDLIRTHAMQFSKEERIMVQRDILAFCLAPTSTPRQSWDSYLILHELFEPETTREERERIMSKLFAQKRPDMAMHVFGHLRQNPQSDRRPTRESYTLCFEGIAATGSDEDILNIVHNMLKLDHEVDPDTKLTNSLMLAYIAAGAPHTALELWSDIVQSKEGPSYNSIRIALMATEGSPRDMHKAEEIWQRLESMRVHITPELYLSYIWVFASNDQLDQAFSMLEEMPKRFSGQPQSHLDATSLAILFNVAPETRHEQLVAWAEENCPGVWKTTSSLPTKESGDFLGRELFDVDRGIRA